ncbi:MAG: hypothetical protein KIS76_17765 [Pyrinomonadaceae bacterium]|nr:hypothetical protein [Pyrinomonadaceae bacterium]
MVFINIPYVVENKRISKESVQKALSALAISEDEKAEAYEAIYNLKPRGVAFGENLQGARELESALLKLNIPFRQSEESEY